MAKRLRIVTEYPPDIEYPLTVPMSLLLCVSIVVAFILTMTPPIHLSNDDIDELVVDPGDAAGITTVSSKMITIVFEARKKPLVLQFPTDGRIRGALVEMCYGPSCTLLTKWKGEQISWHLPTEKGILIFLPLSEMEARLLYKGGTQRVLGKF